MKTIMARTPHDFSFSKRYFHWRKKEDDDDDEEALTSFPSSTQLCMDDNGDHDDHHEVQSSMPVVLPPPSSKKKILSVRSVLAVFGNKHRSSLGTKMVGTLYGYRRGHVHFAFQEDPKSYPTFLIELAMPTISLIREMASGLVRIALECDKNISNSGAKRGMRLLEESLWRTYCNGKKCGFAMRRECGGTELKMLKALEPVTMGAGVLPARNIGEECESEIMFMRARFERVVGSKDSETLYMMNPNGSKGPELSIYLHRV